VSKRQEGGQTSKGSQFNPKDEGKKRPQNAFKGKSNQIQRCGKKEVVTGRGGKKGSQGNNKSRPGRPARALKIKGWGVFMSMSNSMQGIKEKKKFNHPGGRTIKTQVKMYIQSGTIKGCKKKKFSPPQGRKCNHGKGK